MPTLDSAKIQSRGGLSGNDDDFVVVACSCGAQYLYNEETLDLYLDSKDLSRRVLNATWVEIPPCSGCGVLPWDFLELQPGDSRIADGPWSWALAIFDALQQDDSRARVGSSDHREELGPKDTLLLSVDDCFEITGRGLIVAPGILEDEFPGPTELDVQLRAPNGSVREAKVNLEFNFQFPPPKERHYVCVFRELSKEDVQVGTEIWYESRSRSVP